MGRDGDDRTNDRSGRIEPDGDDLPSSQETLLLGHLPNRRSSSAGPACAAIRLGGSGPGQQLFSLIRNPTVIGRSANADVVLPDPAVSDYHARIIRHPFGYTVEDMGSAEGTYLRDQRISHARLVDGDILRLGSTLVSFVCARDSARAMLPRETKARGSERGRPGDPIRGVQPEARQARQDRAPVRVKRAAEDPDSEPGLEDALRKVILAARFVRRNAILILVFAAVGLGLAAASFMFLPPVQAAFCMVTLYPNPKANPIGTENRSRAQTEEMTFFVGAERAFISKEEIASTLKRMGTPGSGEWLAGRVSKRLRFEGAPGGGPSSTYVAKLTPSLFEPRNDWHVRFLDAHVKNYVETEVEKKLKAFVAEVDFLRAQTNAADARVKEIAKQTVDYHEAHADQILAQNALGSAPADLETRRIDLTGQAKRLTGELAGIHSQLARGSALSQARAQSGQSDREALAAVERKLTELRSQGFGDGHPDVVRLRNERTAMRKLIDEHMAADVTHFEKKSNTAHDALQSQADQLQAQLRAVRSALSFIEDNRRSLRVVSGEAPKVNAQLDELVRMKDDAVRQYGLLFDRLKKAEVQLQLERVSAASRYEILSPTQLEYPPGKKAFVTRLAMGLGLGLFLAALILAIRELRRMLARVARELPAVVGLLAVLSTTGMGCAHEARSVWAEDLPVQAAAAEPKIRPGDTLLVEVQKQPTLSGEFVVREDGHYLQPLVGSIPAGDKTPSQVASAVAAALRDVVVGPVVSVWISKSTPIKVTVVGEVRSSGVYELTHDHSLMAALALAGWLTEFAHDDRIFVVRSGASERIRFRVRDLTTAESRFARYQLANSDVVVVE